MNSSETIGYLFGKHDKFTLDFELKSENFTAVREGLGKGFLKTQTIKKIVGEFVCFKVVLKLCDYNELYFQNY